MVVFASSTLMNVLVSIGGKTLPGVYGRETLLPLDKFPSVDLVSHYGFNFPLVRRFQPMTRQGRDRVVEISSQQNFCSYPLHI